MNDDLTDNPIKATSASEHFNEWGTIEKDEWTLEKRGDHYEARIDTNEDQRLDHQDDRMTAETMKKNLENIKEEIEQGNMDPGQSGIQRMIGIYERAIPAVELANKSLESTVPEIKNPEIGGTNP